MAGGVVNVKSREVARFLERQGFIFTGGKGDHLFYRHYAKQIVIQVPTGGKWSSQVPRQTIRHIANFMGMSQFDVIRVIRDS